VVNKTTNTRYVLVPCSTCKKFFYKDKYSLNRTKNHYCSKKCNETLFKKGHRPWNYLGERAYKLIKCDYCGKKTKRVRSQVRAYKHHFCSKKCNGHWKAEYLVGSLIYNWKGGYQPYYGPNWRVQRYKCRIRDKNTCQICGITAQELGKNLDVDHKIPFEAFNGDYKKANDLDNLWCLCPSCHAKKTNWQTKYGKLTYEQWVPLIKQWYPK